MVSVIIPVLNEAKTIRQTIEYVFKHVSCKRLLREVIVVDGGSTDDTVAEASKTRARIVKCKSKERANLLNLGARRASGRILYFMNASSLPPKNFIDEIVKAQVKGYDSGTFAIKYDHSHWLLNLLSWFSRQKKALIQVSDQSLFITRELFEKSGGFREDHLVMSTQEMIARLKRYSNFIIFKDEIITSAAKYVRNGILKTGIVQGLVYLMHRRGFNQINLAKLYRQHLHWDIGQPVTEKKKPVGQRQIRQMKPGNIPAVSARH